MRVLNPQAWPVADQPAHPGIDRRTFLKSVGAGLVIALQLPVAAPSRAGQPTKVVTGFAPNAFVTVTPDNLVIVQIKHHEMGQGVTTGLSTIVAEELDADWKQIRTEYAPADVKLYANSALGLQGTGGSTAIFNSWDQLRQAGASARAMLIQAAALQWQVPESEITARQSVLSHASGKRASYGDMANAAAGLPVPSKVRLKDPGQFTLIGKQDLRRLDSPAKSRGSATYGIDVKLPGLLTAVIARPPAFGAVVKSFDAAAAMRVAGVTDVVQVPEGIAVVAKGTWAAIKGRAALKVDWDLSRAEKASSESLLAEYRRLASSPGAVAERRGDAAAALKNSIKVVDAVYEFPFLAHAPMEPLSCVAWLRDGALECYGGFQFQTVDLANAAQAAALPEEKVSLHCLVSGGSFGRRANAPSDYLVEAVHVAKAIGGRAPVRTQRTREDDMRLGYYRPLYVHAVRAGIDAQGAPSGWLHTIAGQSIMAGTPMESAMVQNGIDETSVEGVKGTAYALQHFSADLHSPRTQVPVLWWRSVGNTHTAYVMETMIDELAEAAGQDAVAYRLPLLADKPRHLGVLKLAAEKSGWGTPLAAGRARGIAVHESFKTFVAQVAEVSIGSDGKVRVHRVTCAVDCGVAVNPDIVRAQMEGGIGFALAAALHSELEIRNGAAVQGNFDSYRMLRIQEMPQVDVHIVSSGEAPTGVGEPGVPPLAPAVANAIAKLTGRRVRRLPFSRHDLRTA